MVKLACPETMNAPILLSLCHLKRKQRFTDVADCSLVYLFTQVSQQAAKCIPAMACPELTEQIRREVAAALHRRKGEFPCYFFTDIPTFTLPAGDTYSLLTELHHCLSVIWTKVLLNLLFCITYRY